MANAKTRSRQLIINADGFGFTRGINRAVFECAEAGTVTSTSCNCNFDAIEDAGALQKEFPELSIGIHFNLSVGRPVLHISEVPSLVGKNGEFLRDRLVARLITGRVSTKEMYQELSAQAARLSDLGVRISHCDGHQNKHLYPGYFGAVIKVAKRFGIPAIRCHRRYLFSLESSNRRTRVLQYYATHPQRLVTHMLGRMRTRLAECHGLMAADRLITPAYVDDGKKFALETWLRVISHLPAGTNEIYCHPAYPDDELRRFATYVDQRKTELEILTSEPFRRCLLESDVEVISFHQLVAQK